MATQMSNCFLLVLVLGLSINNVIAHDTASLNRSSFPADFIFGAASASYQYEGGANEGGRGPSIWDTFTHKYPEKIDDHSTGDVAVDSYHRYKEDVGIVKSIGFDSYRFSISWSRVLPNGKISGGVNQEGVNYYNNLINELLAKGIQPLVTLFHWDLPQALEDEYGGFRRRKIVDDYQNYVELCFQKFGDRVKHWITLNEPSVFSVHAYAVGVFAPGRCSPSQKQNCTGGNSGTEPYIVAHNLLLAHASAAKLYRQKYQATQKGKIGITLNSDWFLPISKDKRHVAAAKRALDFSFGWFMDPLTYGDYPSTMKSYVGKRLPQITKEDAKLINGSFDFLGLNYYTTNYAADLGRSENLEGNYLKDSCIKFTTERNGVPIGPRAASQWLYVYPRGIRHLLAYAKNKYNDPLIYITENGVDEENNATLPLKEALNDQLRIYYHYTHLSNVRKAIVKDGVNVRGYYVWSLLDNFGFTFGFSVRFGLNFVDYKDGLKRYPKRSAHWFKDFLKK